MGAPDPGVGACPAGVGVGGSLIFSTSPAGVRSGSIGVVSGVGEAGAGVAFSAACRSGWPAPPHEAAASEQATRAAAMPAMRGSLIVSSEVGGF